MKKEFNLSCIQLTDFVSVSTRSFKEEVALALHSFCLVTICCCCRISFLIALVFLLGSIVIAETLCPILSIVPRADLVPMCDAGRCSSVLASNAPSGFSLLMRICVLPSGWRAYQNENTLLYFSVNYNFKHDNTECNKITCADSILSLMTNHLHIS